MLTLSVGAILLLTLFPVYGGNTPNTVWCLICGDRGAADAINNVLLFLPLGFSAAQLTRRRRPIILGAALLSACVEAAQLVIPGRDTNPSDFLYNTLGAAAGIAAAALLARCVAAAPRAAARASLVAACCAALVVAATGWLLGPAFPSGWYFGQWTADLRHLERYEGRLLEASVGDEPLGSGLIRTDLVREHFTRGEPLRLLVVAGPAPRRLAPIFSVFDGYQRRILLLGADGPDLVFEARTRAGAARMDEPSSRIPGALAAVAPGDTLRLGVSRESGRYCVSVSAEAHCFPLPGPVAGWRVLYGLEGADPAFRRGVDLLWAALLVLPVGLCLRRRRESAVAMVVVVLALLALPHLVGLRPAGAMELAAAALGVGWGVAWAGLRRRAAAAPAPGGGVEPYPQV